MIKHLQKLFPNIGVKRQTCNNEELTENKEVAYTEMKEGNETSFCDSHFEIIDTDDQVATQPSFKSLIASEALTHRHLLMQCF